jgi:hypothetical protein
MEVRQRARKRNRIIGIVLIVLGLLLAAIALWPTFRRTEVFSIESELLPQRYRLEVRFPVFGPAGDKAAVNLKLKPEGDTADFPAPGEPNPVVVAEIQSSTVNVKPDGQISTPLQSGKGVNFSWEIESLAAGESQFNLFLLRAAAEEVNGVYLQQPVWARSFPYRTFSGAGGLKVPLLFFAVFGGLFGLGLLAQNAVRGSSGMEPSAPSGIPEKGKFLRHEKKSDASAGKGGNRPPDRRAAANKLLPRSRRRLRKSGRHRSGR